MKILHLSDLHFKNNDNSQDIILSSLLKKISLLIKNESKPNVLIITGDIAFSGKTEEYNKALEYIQSIATVCEINNKRIFIIPGNHDVDRDMIDKRHIGWWYAFKTEEEVTGNLSSEDSFPKIIAKSQAYMEFFKKCMSNDIQIGKFGQYLCKLQYDTENGKKEVIIAGLNSSLFCGYDGDENGKLALGMEQVNFFDQTINPDEDIVITCIHHPFKCFHPCEQTTLNILQRFSDVILSGHVHEASNSAIRDGSVGETIFITAGASYKKREQENGFNIIELDLSTLKGQVTIYKYLPQTHFWTINKDINQDTDGIFNFEIHKENCIGLSDTTGNITLHKKPLNKYIATLNISFDELNRDKVNAIFNHLKAITGDTNITITKMEEGSVKIYFESTKEVSENIDQVIEQGKELKLLEINKVNKDDFYLEPAQQDSSVYHWETYVRPDFFEIIHNPGAAFSHNRVDDLKLKDLFVSPNLKIMNIGEIKQKIVKIINAEETFVKEIGKSIKVVVYGADNSGKSTLIKWWYNKYYEQGYIPILISGNDFKDISIDKIKKLVQKEFSKQYTGIIGGTLENYDPDRIIIIIDDFHKIRFTNSKYKTNLISNLNKSYNNLFITGSELMQFETYNSKNGIARSILDDFKWYQIIEFGPNLRYELIKKWNGLGSEQLEPNELIRLNKESEKHIESIIGKNFVPSYPVYLLTILQSIELNNAQKPEYSLHGFYYELLINEALSKAVKNKADISLFYNFITDYSYFLFENKIRFEPLYINDFLKFHLNYCDDYKVRINPTYILDTFVKSKILILNNETVAISYKYVYYFFVARYLANNISNQEIKNKIKSLCQRVHRDEFASIVMFLTHLSKDQFIIDQLLENSRALFSEYTPIKLEEDVAFINEMINKLPQQVYVPIDVAKMKEEELREEEELDLQEREFNAQKDIYDYDLNEDISTLDVLSKMIKATKTIEIIGQVTKKYWGELKAPQKFDLAEETYMLGLRTTGFFYSLLGKNIEMFVEYLKYIYRKKHLNKNISREDVEKASRDFLFGLCVMYSFGITKRVTNAIGYEKLSGTFEDIVKKHNYISVKLIDISIKLDHNKSFPWADIKLLKTQTSKQFLANTVLKNLVINYLYVFYTTIEDKQKICTLLDIKLDQQRMIDSTSSIKKESS